MASSEEAETTAREMVLVPRDLFESILSGEDEDCWFDHHGGCQAHGYLSLEPGEICPVKEASDLVKTWD